MHTCHAIGCSKPIAPERLMCYAHWLLVPASLRRRIWHAYRPDQCDDWQPSAEYCDAAKEAVIAVAKAEGRAIYVDDPKLVLYDMLRSEVSGRKRGVTDGS